MFKTWQSGDPGHSSRDGAYISVVKISQGKHLDWLLMGDLLVPSGQLLALIDSFGVSKRKEPNEFSVSRRALGLV